MIAASALVRGMANVATHRYRDYIAGKQRSSNDSTNHDIALVVMAWTALCTINRNYGELRKIINSACVSSMPLAHPSSAASNLATRAFRSSGRYRTCCSYVALHVACGALICGRALGRGRAARANTHTSTCSSSSSSSIRGYNYLE